MEISSLNESLKENVVLEDLEDGELRESSVKGNEQVNAVELLSPGSPESNRLVVKLKLPVSRNQVDSDLNAFEVENSKSTQGKPEDKTSFSKAKRKARKKKTDDDNDQSFFDEFQMESDDGKLSMFQLRLTTWAQKRSQLRLQIQHNEADSQPLIETEDLVASEIQLPHPSYEDGVFENKLRIPGEIFQNLFDYQKDGVHWLWKRHKQNGGAIIGDDMGLGKTVQMISFLAALNYSNITTGATVIVCPATLMNQWIKEFHHWWPPLRVAILHSTGAAFSSNSDPDKDALKLIRTFNKKGTGHVLVTTYETVKKYSKALLTPHWDYVILDEGHKIRNPDSEVTLTVKGFKSTHRIILSGTPIQNSYRELWSLMDFVEPGKFGTLPVFEENLASRVKAGGYRHATDIEVQIAYYCAHTIVELIQPYMLRRTKADVAVQRPKQTDQVLFCKLTSYQRDLYKEFLKQREMKEVVYSRKLQPKNRVNFIWAQITKLTKICNHPDIYLKDHDASFKGTKEYGRYSFSGKMEVVKSLLEMWKPNGHRVLLFSQSTEMLDILEKFILGLGYVYRRLDGSTPIKKRIFLVEEFNSENDIYILLVTTKVGGVGLNLTGADRIIIYDPDWNPSNDDQATERAARPGQTRNVAIYRLMTSGTIEEKIYHRQLFKRMMSNKITKKPSKNDLQFEAEELYDLFSLGDPDAKEIETSHMFGDAEIRESESKKRKTISLNMWDRFLNDTVNKRPVSRLPRLESAASEYTTDDNTLNLKLKFHELPKFKKRNPTHLNDSNDEANSKKSSASSVKNMANSGDKQSASQQKNGVRKRKREDIHDITSIAKVEDWQVSSEDKSKGDEENDIIQTLYKTAGLHSVFKHDKVLNAKSSSSGTYQALVDKKAREAAEEARNALEFSRRRLKDLPIGTLTWTGQSGKPVGDIEQRTDPWDFSQYR